MNSVFSPDQSLLNFARLLAYMLQCRRRKSRLRRHPPSSGLRSSFWTSQEVYDTSRNLRRRPQRFRLTASSCAHNEPFPPGNTDATAKDTRRQMPRHAGMRNASRLFTVSPMTPCFCTAALYEVRPLAGIFRNQCDDLREVCFPTTGS